MRAITVEKLTKAFPAPGRGAFGRRHPRPPVAVVQGLTFSIAEGERVAFIGPNGAGKSTTLKMLTGILYPTSGHAEVAGFVPWLERRHLARQIGIVFGQRSQLWYHLPVQQSFALLARIYDVDRTTFARQSARLAQRFAIADLLERPPAQLSLGQRLRCEIAAALLHQPALLLLDEPTIGLDVTAKAALRDHLNTLAREDGTTIMLTSHDTGDIERICERVIIIDRGRLLLDRSLDRLRRAFLKRRAIALVTDEQWPQLALAGVSVIAAEPYRLTIAVDTAVTPIERLVAAALERLSVRDLVIENTPLEEVVTAIYRGEIGGASDALPP